MPSKKTPAPKRAARAVVKSKTTGAGGIQKRSQRPTRPVRDANTPESSEPESSAEMFGDEDSMKTRFQEMDARIQANEHTLCDLSASMSEVLQILRQPASSIHQRATLSMPQAAPELHRPSSYQNPTTGIDAQSNLYAYSYSPTDNNPHLSTDLLSRWDWIDADTVDTIIKGTFDLNNLPKLFREYTDRQAHTISTTNEVHLPANGTQPYVITTKTKLLPTFPNLARFLSAWIVYCAIRCAYKPEYAAGFYHWQERLIYRARVHKD